MNVSFNSARDIVLREIYDEVYHSDEAEFFTIEGVKDLCGGQLSIPFLRKVMEYLLARRYVRTEEKAGREQYTITAEGIRAAERVEAKGDDVAFQIATVPAADRTVAIRHNSAQFKEVLTALTAADDAVRSSNTIPEAQRSWIREQLQAGRDLISKAKVVTWSAIKALLLAPLHAAYKSVAEGALKAMLVKALLIVRDWMMS